MRGFYTNPSRADDCFVPFKGFPSVGSIFSFSGTSIIDFTATDDCLFVMSTYAQNFSHIETLAELIVNTGSTEPNTYPVYTRVYKMKKGQRIYAYNYLSGAYYYSIVGIEIK